MPTIAESEKFRRDAFRQLFFFLKRSVKEVSVELSGGDLLQNAFANRLVERIEGVRKPIIRKVNVADGKSGLIEEV